MQPTIYKLNQAIRTAKRMINDNVPGGRKCLAQALEAKYALEMGHANPPPPITPVAVPAENTILPARFYELVDELRQGQIIWTSATIPTVRNRINREFLEILLPLAKTQENTPLIKFDERQESFLTVSLTPTLDLKYCSKTQTATLHAGGKALNHMRACQILGIEHAVVGFGSTARTGQILSQLCQIGGKLPTNVHLTEIDDDLRIVTILDDEIWKAPGPKITNKQLKEIAETFDQQAKNHSWLGLCGALPVGVSKDFILDILAKYGKSHKIVMDSADMWEHGIVRPGGPSPFFIKPNMREFTDLARKHFWVDALSISENSSPTDPAVIALARKFVDELKIPLVVVSKDDEPFIAASQKETIKVTPPKVEVLGGVGCGDALVIGMLDVLTRHTIDINGNLETGLVAEAARRGSAFAAASAEQAGTGFANDLSRIEQLELATRIETL
ncbi:MAG: PfkB family carbohydrate kinase [bacterium]